MRTYSLYMVNDFSGGLNLKAAPMSVADNQATGLLNFEFDVTGALVKRRGITLYNGSPVSGATGVDNLIRFYRNDGTKTLVAVMGGATAKKVYKGADGAGTFTEITGGTALSASACVDMLVYRDTLFMSNGTQPIQYYQSGATKANVSGTPTPPVGKYLAVCDNRLFAAGNESSPNRIYFSGIGLFSSLPNVDFPELNFIDIPRRDSGDVITGLAVYRDELFVFRRNDIWALMGSGPEDYYLQEVNNSAGAVSHRAVANTGDSLVFAAQGHIYEYANGGIVDIGLPVEPLIGALDAGAAKAFYYPLKNQVWVCAAKAGALNDTALVYDRAHRAWSVFDIGLLSLCAFSGAGDSGEIYGGAPGAGIVSRLDTGTDDAGEPIPFSYSTKHFYMGAPQARKCFRRLFFNVNTAVEAGAFDVQASVDFGRLVRDVSGIKFKGFNKWGEFVYGHAVYGGGALQTAATPLAPDMAGRYVSVTMSGSGDEPLTVYSVGLQHKIKRLRGE